MLDVDNEKPKPLKKCRYCHGEKKDAFWTVFYRRYILGRELKVKDPVCDEHLAKACCRAHEGLRVRPRFLFGPGGNRIMPNGMVPAA